MPPTPQIYRRSYQVEWRDIDFNGHMRNTAYLDRAGHVRMSFLHDHGFTPREFERLRIGPVVFKDEILYFKESRMLAVYHVNLRMAAVSKDYSRFQMRNEFSNDEGERLAVVVTTGAWMDLRARKLTVPPGDLVKVLGQMQRTDDFLEIPGN